MSFAGANQCTKSEVVIFSYSRDILGRLKFFKKLCGCRATVLLYRVSWFSRHEFLTGDRDSCFDSSARTDPSLAQCYRHKSLSRFYHIFCCAVAIAVPNVRNLITSPSGGVQTIVMLKSVCLAQSSGGGAIYYVLPVL